MVIVGLDIGIASIGFAVVDLKAGTILSSGVHLFDAAEVPKTGASLAEPRRTKRLGRRTIRRRAEKRKMLRNCLRATGFHDLGSFDDRVGDKEKATFDPWQLRADALERALSQPEFASVLAHLCKRRGFKSNSKAERGNADKESSAMLAALSEQQKKMHKAGAETIGQFLSAQKKKRNNPNSYDHTVARADVEHELVKIFERQRSFGNQDATVQLQENCHKIIFDQRPIQSSIKLVGPCYFFPEEKRAPKMSYSAELFIAWGRLNNLTLRDDNDNDWPLSLD